MKNRHSEDENDNIRSLDIEEEEVQDTTSKKLIKAKDIARKVKSFDHFIFIWGEKGQYYLPPKSIMSWHYISQVLAQEKRLLKLEDVGHQLEVPKIKGNAVNDMYEKVKGEEGLHYYFPDFADSQNVARDYFFNVTLKRS